ncbi:MAG: ABC transporter permease [Candidatus Dormibacteraeota bacterium]|uniref:ABC transporter permease n=1 Tax=Candidatus Dormiibacter inghamiae TaxID=3127013 RepID=A0A934NCB0_9BACT|nr:ABC transporter permease [Candidatus Dormibacteraeota bacterium]MBJ7606478.1 ABC transporter permease [Candidatus Dormibacteraeota bacterium]
MNVIGLARRAAPILFLIFCVVAWQLICTIAHVRTYVLPAPSAILLRLYHSWSILEPHTLVTLEETLVGFVLGSLVGFVLALLIAYNRLVEEMLYPLIVASQAVPKLAIAPLFILWFGFGIWPKVVVTILLVFFPVVVTSAEGLLWVDRNLIDLLRSVSANPLQVFLKVRLPHALPQVLAGLKIGITLAVVGAVVGEWVGADKGLGYLIIFADSQLDTTLSFASITVLVAMGVVLFLGMDVLGRLITPWQRVRVQDPGL